MKFDLRENADRQFLEAPGIRAALRLLLESHDLAQKAQRPIEEFALRFPSLLQQGATAQALHWLVSKNYVQCATGRRRPAKQQSDRAMVFTEKTGFALTNLGMVQARLCVHASDSGGLGGELPHWDGRVELSFAGQVVKVFRGPAESQTTILAAFQFKHWIRTIENPLPWHSQDDPQKSLRNAVQRLNGSQITKLLAFHVTHCGTGVSWDDLRMQRSNGDESASLSRTASAGGAQSARRQSAG